MEKIKTVKDSAEDRKRIWTRIEKHDDAIQSIASARTVEDLMKEIKSSEEGIGVDGKGGE
mgnify:CR=1 FL=1